ncbi:MAG TPA: hypothetical protein VLB82_02935 [Thermodesulfobacteriota bacterium]|nr:hypothetical protein [Thermodesulfobacteriota bacterium]
MKKVLSFFLALNIFLCYGGLCDLCHALGPEPDTAADCHSMGAMQMEQSTIDTSLDFQISSIEENISLCQYFLLSKSFEIEDNLYDGEIFTELFISQTNNYNYIFEKSSFKIPDRAIPTELFIKNSSYLI